MEFSRVGEHTIRCVISEQEIEEMGYSLEDLMTNSEKSQTFLNQIFLKPFLLKKISDFFQKKQSIFHNDMAEQEFQMNFDLGIRTVRADFLPDHNISLTFSEHQGSSAMLDHLKDIVNNMLSSIPEQYQEKLKMEAQKNEKMQGRGNRLDTNKESVSLVSIIAMARFDSLDRVISFAKQIKGIAIPDSELLKFKDYYVLAMDLSLYKEKEVYSLSAIIDEYAGGVEVGIERLAYYEEHGEIIIEENVIEELQEI